MSVLREHVKTIERRIGEEICRFANGVCDCQNRDRLCERVEVQTKHILRLAAQVPTATVAQSSPACDVAQRALAIADDMVRMMMDRGALLAVRDNDGELVPMDLGRQFQLKAGWQTAIAGALKSSGVEQP